MLDLHLRVFRQARRQAFVTLNDLEELRTVIRAINRLESLLTGCIFVALAVHGIASITAPVHGLTVLAIRPQTLHPDNLTSASRNGVVDHYRVRTEHTNTHWVIKILQPVTLQIPRSDPDFADVVMVVLHQGTGADGRRYLDQAKIGRIFKISRQMAHVRTALYKRRDRIEDVLNRERRNHHLTPRMVETIHRMILEDPFLGASEIRRRLYAQGLLPRLKDISLTTLTQAIQTVDYIAVRQKIEEMLRRGELVPDHQKLCQVLLREMNHLAEIAGGKIGQHIIPIVQLIDPTPDVLSQPSIPTKDGKGELEEFLDLPEPDDHRLAPGWRGSFVHYFTFGASYREIASFLGVHPSTVYRRLVSIRERLPPLVKLLGTVLFSGVIGIDEKYILVPKPHRDGKMARWAYLFIAVDPYSYDLLHAEVYPARTTDCARAFLVGLKASGVLKPKVIVTDLWGPYETVVPEAYPGVIHHQCVFHAEQAASKLMRDKLGKDYRRVPEAQTLWTSIVQVFRAGCRRTLIRRYGKLLQQKESLLVRCPDLSPVFESLARHFEKLANAYTDRQRMIPLTNNATELVFRTFTRRYKTMAGFESLKTARAYVRLWTYYYRFRPFSPDANPRIRNKSPLQIAGYNVQGLKCLDLVMPPPKVEV